MIPESPVQHRIHGLERVQYRALGCGPFHREPHFAIDTRQRSKLTRQKDSDHGKVWASTESTAGRSRTMAVQ